MNAILSLRDGRKANSIGGGSTRINVWEKLCKLSNDLLTLKDPNGRDIFPHNLPKNWKALKRNANNMKRHDGSAKKKAIAVSFINRMATNTRQS